VMVLNWVSSTLN